MNTDRGNGFFAPNHESEIMQSLTLEQAADLVYGDNSPFAHFEPPVGVPNSGKVVNFGVDQAGREFVLLTDAISGKAHLMQL